MARIAGTNIPEKKRILYALPYVYGIGRPLAAKILDEAKVDKNKISGTLNAEEIRRIASIIESRHIVEGELRRQIAANIKRLREIKSYRGIRHIKGLPVRGQRTRTNSRTRRGNVRRTTISGKRKMEKT